MWGSQKRTMGGFISLTKVSRVQGNPGEGNTALPLAAACTTRGTLPGPKAPLSQSCGFTRPPRTGKGIPSKPRLKEAEADLDRVLVIDEAKRELTLPTSA